MSDNILVDEDETSTKTDAVLQENAENTIDGTLSNGEVLRKMEAKRTPRIRKRQLKFLSHIMRI